MKRSCPKSFFFFFFPLATAFSVWKDGSGEKSQWPWRHHAPGREQSAHPLVESSTPTRLWHGHLAAMAELCSVCTPHPLSFHASSADTKKALKLGKQKHNKGAKRGQQAASILLPPSPSSFSLHQMFTFPLGEKRGMWTDRVRKERNLAEGKAARAFKVCHRAVTKAS